MHPATNTSNGTASKQSVGNDRVFALQIRSVKANEAFIARTLSEEYVGIFTHFMRGKSYYCAGDECNTLHHKYERVWKGYAAVEVWTVDVKKWIPYVLEITEHMELDLRGLWARGQHWEIFRPAQVDRKPTAAQAKLHKQLDPATFPPAPPILPVLQTRYHSIHINTAFKNPLPPRIVVTASDDAPPDILATNGHGPNLTPEEVEKMMKEHQAKLNAQKRGAIDKHAGATR